MSQSLKTQTTTDVAVDEVIADAIRLIDLHHRLKSTLESARDDLQVELETQLTTLRIHAESAEALLDAETDALSDND